MFILPSWAQLAKGNKVKSCKGWGGGGIKTKTFIIFSYFKISKSDKSLLMTKTKGEKNRYSNLLMCTSYKEICEDDQKNLRGKGEIHSFGYLQLVSKKQKQKTHSHGTCV